MPSLKEVVATLTRARGGVKANRYAQFGSGIFKRRPISSYGSRVAQAHVRTKTTEGVLDCTNVLPHRARVTTVLAQQVSFLPVMEPVWRCLRATKNVRGGNVSSIKASPAS